VWSRQYRPFQNLRRMQGNCSAPMPDLSSFDSGGPAMLPQNPGQCLIVLTAERGISIPSISPDGRDLWMDNLYIREGDEGSIADDLDQQYSKPLAALRWLLDAPVSTGPQVWFTNITVQGNGKRPAVGLLFSTSIYVEGAARSADRQCKRVRQ
jgi:hypothetical protein